VATRAALAVADECIDSFGEADCCEQAEPNVSEDDELQPSTALHLGVGICVVALALLMGYVMGSIEFILSLNGALFAVAQNEAIGRTRFALLEKMVQPCGPPPAKPE
jgi:hypothetical protein